MVTTRITATLSVRDWPRAFAFYQEAFGAKELMQVPGGGVGQLAIGEADFWVAEESTAHQNFSPETLGGCSVRMLIVTEDPAALFGRAIAAGATVVAQMETAHGWMLGRVVDPFGHHWEIGKQIG